jgi:hypothetical protein
VSLIKFNDELGPELGLAGTLREGMILFRCYLLYQNLTLNLFLSRWCSWISRCTCKLQYVIQITDSTAAVMEIYYRKVTGSIR